MPKGLKLVLILMVPLALVLGGAYGLAKIGAIPLPKAKAWQPVWKVLGLAKPKPGIPAAGKNVTATANADAAKKAADEQQQAAADAKQQAADEQQAREKAAAYRAAQNAVDPKNIARLAAIYEEMPTENVAKILELLPDAQVLALLRSMDEKKVADILAANKPERAARLTLALSRPVENKTTVSP